MKISTSVIVLICSLVLALAGWMTTLHSWSDATSPSTLAGLLQVQGGIILAWLSASPIKPKNGSDNGNGKPAAISTLEAAQLETLKAKIADALANPAQVSKAPYPSHDTR